MALCKKIGTGTLPIFVDVKPEPYTKPNECFPNVELKIKRDGGERQLGWIIWERHNVLVEGEFHSVWKAPGGELLCVSAREDGERRLVFLPDHTRQYGGIPTGNIGLAWPPNPAVERVLEAEASLWRFLHSRTDLATKKYCCSPSELAVYQQAIEIAKKEAKL